MTNMVCLPVPTVIFGKTTPRAVTMEDAQRAVTFLFEYAEIHALFLPG